jgi:hypothetical protein
MSPKSAVFKAIEEISASIRGVAAVSGEIEETISLQSETAGSTVNHGKSPYENGELPTVYFTRRVVE